jgi:hypothetical protein
MSNVTLVPASATIRPFYWGPYESGQYSTALAIPSLGKAKETIYSTFWANLTATVAGPTATIQIQGTLDALTGQGITIPVVLTNNSTAVTLPTPGYTLTVIDGNNAPTGQRTVSTVTPQSFYALPVDRAFSIYAGAQPPVTGPVALVTGMTAQGITGLAANTTITVNNAGSLTLSGNFTGTTGTYLVNFANNYWAATPLGTITLAGGAALFATDGFMTAANWKYVRANVTAITGTNPSLQVWMAA